MFCRNMELIGDCFRKIFQMEFLIKMRGHACVCPCENEKEKRHPISLLVKLLIHLGHGSPCPKLDKTSIQTCVHLCVRSEPFLPSMNSKSNIFSTLRLLL